MMKADVGRLAWALGMLRRSAGLANQGKQAGSMGAPDASFHKTFCDSYQEARSEFEKYNLLTSIDRLTLANHHLKNIPNYPFSQIEIDCTEISYCAESELKRIYFGYVPHEKAREILDGVERWSNALEAFPSISRNAFEASCCYAYGCDDAAVFHSMMILERGLSRLAKKLGVKYDARNWHGIIDDIEAEIDKRVKATRSKKPSDFSTFLSVAAKEFRYFKDAWRNHTAHGRAEYDENDARKVLTHVRDFMEHIGTRLQEPK